MSHAAETPFEAALRYVIEQEAMMGRQRTLIHQAAAQGRSTDIAKRDLAGMERALILLRARAERLSGVRPDASAWALKDGKR